MQHFKAYSDSWLVVGNVLNEYEVKEKNMKKVSLESERFNLGFW